jgi:hypothetical protein
MDTHTYGGSVFIAACCARTDKRTAQAKTLQCPPKGNRKWKLNKKKIKKYIRKYLFPFPQYFLGLVVADEFEA